LSYRFPSRFPRSRPFGADPAIHSQLTVPELGIDNVASRLGLTRGQASTPRSNRNGEIK